VRNDYFKLMEEKRVHKYSRWQRAREKLEGDSRYAAVSSSTQREQWWEEYIASRQKVKRVVRVE